MSSPDETKVMLGMMKEAKRRLLAGYSVGLLRHKKTKAKAIYWKQGHGYAQRWTIYRRWTFTCRDRVFQHDYEILLEPEALIALLTEAQP